MKFFVTGATGFIGQALVLRLLRDGHEVKALVRSADRARSLLGADVALCTRHDGSMGESLSDSEVIINLAGKPLIGDRWDDRTRSEIRSSRVDLTQEIVDLIPEDGKERVLLSASAVGVYGNRGDEKLSEEAPAGSGFLAELCSDWEAAAFAAEKKGVRVACLRIGVVLDRGGGALAQMLLPFRMGAGGPIGSGKQFVPWIHRRDLVELFVEAATNPEYIGAVNATAPQPVPFAKFAKSLGTSLRRPAVIPVPGFMLKIIFGDAAQVLLEGQNAVPTKALQFGFTFEFETLSEAFDDITQNQGVSITPFNDDLPESSYLQKRVPRYALKTRTVIPAPLKDVFSFFSQAENLGILTPPSMQFNITRKSDEMKAGVIIEYRLKLGIIPLFWRTRIERFDIDDRFVDTQEKGPYLSWWHEHRFEEQDGHTIMTDTVLYSVPMGRLANTLVVEDQLKEVFSYRTSMMRLRFNAKPS